MTSLNILYQFNKPYHIHKIPVPPPEKLNEHDMLIKVAAASYCHTDAMVAAGLMRSKLPLTASHEGAGTVVALGSAAKGFEKDDRVLIGPVYHRCGQCADCATENEQYCTTTGGGLGFSTNGAFAEYEIVDAREAMLLPDNISFQNAPSLACAGRAIWGALMRADLKSGQSIAIVGSGGGLGHLGVQFAKALGLYVVAIDARDEALGLSKSCGADIVIDARKAKTDVIQDVQNVTDGCGVDAAVNASDAKGAASIAVAIIKKHGTMVQVAQVRDTLSKRLELRYSICTLVDNFLASRGCCAFHRSDLARYHNQGLPHVFKGTGSKDARGRVKT